MKGQYRILSEVLIFAVGLAIASYVSLSFSDVRDFIGMASTRDKLENAANAIANSVIISTRENSFLVLEIPESVSGKGYSIRVLDAGGGECTKPEDCFLNMSTTDVSVSKQLFNISQNYNIKGDVYSTARFLTITSRGGEIILGRL